MAVILAPDGVFVKKCGKGPFSTQRVRLLPTESVDIKCGNKPAVRVVCGVDVIHIGTINLQSGQKARVKCLPHLPGNKR